MPSCRFGVLSIVALGFSRRSNEKIRHPPRFAFWSSFSDSMLTFTLASLFLILFSKNEENFFFLAAASSGSVFLARLTEDFLPIISAAVCRSTFPVMLKRISGLDCFRWSRSPKVLWVAVTVLSFLTLSMPVTRWPSAPEAVLFCSFEGSLGAEESLLTLRWCDWVEKCLERKFMLEGFLIRDGSFRLNIWSGQSYHVGLSLAGVRPARTRRREHADGFLARAAGSIRPRVFASEEQEA